MNPDREKKVEVKHTSTRTHTAPSGRTHSYYFPLSPSFPLATPEMCAVTLRHLVSCTQLYCFPGITTQGLFSLFCCTTSWLRGRNSSLVTSLYKQKSLALWGIIWEAPRSNSLGISPLCLISGKIHSFQLRHDLQEGQGKIMMLAHYFPWVSCVPGLVNSLNP